VLREFRDFVTKLLTAAAVFFGVVQPLSAYNRRGAAGAPVSLGGRIVAVADADAYEVMTAPRTDKGPVQPDAARAELARCAGGQFDAQVVRALLAVPLRRLARARPARRPRARPVARRRLDALQRVGLPASGAPPPGAEVHPVPCRPGPTSAAASR
jgi:hypothetical protein